MEPEARCGFSLVVLRVQTARVCYGVTLKYQRLKARLTRSRVEKREQPSKTMLTCLGVVAEPCSLSSQEAEAEGQ